MCFERARRSTRRSTDARRYHRAPITHCRNKHAEAPSEQLKVHPELRKQAVAMGAIAADCLLTSNQVMAKASAKKACSSKAQSVDMESFEIVKEAQAWGAQSVVVRAISDSAKEDLPINFNLTLSKKQQVSVS